MQGIRETDFQELDLVNRGKVRDIYKVDDKLLVVATDRISAFDVVMDDPIPDKGRILNRISVFWFKKTSSIIQNHFITSDPEQYPQPCRPYRDNLYERSMLVNRAKPLPVECIARGYLSGSGWVEYNNTGSISGISLPPGLKESSELPEPIFTPSTKAELGLHDENISFEQTVDMVGEDIAEEIRRISLELYKYGRDLACRKGIIIADTKFEFGLLENRPVLIDEALTPDSSRFWPMDKYEPGRPQKSFDKQFLRDYLNVLAWQKKPPPPKLPPDIIRITREKYIEALERLTGETL